jgi:hypothetical protein
MARGLVRLFVFSFFAFVSTSVIGFAAAAADEAPGCSNGDCPPPPPCSNGDCPPPPTCTNGDCPPEEPVDCCCVGSNVEGTTRVCCCRSTDLDTVNCRDSQVVPPDESGEFHLTIAEATMDGFRPAGCDALLQKFCDPPVEEVCTRKRGLKVCEKVVKRICQFLDQVCQYRFCGPNWFPYDEPAPDTAGCEWWAQIRDCTP